MWLTVLFTDGSVLGVEHRPAVVQVAQQTGSAEIGDDRSWWDDSPGMLANQAKFRDFVSGSAGKAVFAWFSQS